MRYPNPNMYRVTFERNGELKTVTAYGDTPRQAAKQVVFQYGDDINIRFADLVTVEDGISEDW